MKGRSPHTTRNTTIVKVALAALFVLVVGLLIPTVFSIVGATVSYPVITVSNWLRESTGVFPSYIRERAALHEDIRKLENELVAAGGINVTLKQLSEENTLLRSLLSADGSKRIAAAVTARPNELPYDVLQIDRGSLHGVQVGAPVYIDSDSVIGLIVHVSAQYSFVQLFTTPGFSATAFISGPDVVATVEGYGGGVARVRVPQGIPIAEGNLVLLPSIETGIFGTISYVENLPTQPEQYGYITPNVSIPSLYFVAIGTEVVTTKSASDIDETVREYLQTLVKIEGVSLQVSSSTATVTEATSTELLQ